ncbi:MAG: TonB-dependent receptor [Henriciella sp.]
MKVSRRSKYALFASASFAAMSLGTSLAFAQEDSESGEAEARRLNTIEVSATRRDGATIQDVPIAVTAVSAEDLERAGVADITSLDNVAPSFNMNSSNSESGGTTLRIRGVGTTGNNIGLESAVGVFLDGVYLSRPGIALADLLDVEQVEVLRGPQGTLFGRNTSAGALSIRTKKPDLGSFGGFANVTAGNYDLRNVQGGLNIPIVEDKFGVRVSGALRERDGYLTNINGDDIGSRDRMTLRGQALYDAGDYGEIRFIVDYADGDDRCCDAVWHNEAPVTAFPLFGLPADGGAPNIGGPDPDDYDSNGQGNFNPFEQWGASLTYEQDFGFADFTYIGSYRDYESAGSFRDDDYTGLRIFTTGPSEQARATGNDIEGRTQVITKSHEARFQGVAFNDRLDWLVGLYYSEEEIRSGGTLTLLDQFQPAVSGGTALAGLNPFFASFYGPGVNDPLTALAGGASSAGDFAHNEFSQDAESISIFTHNVLQLTDQFNLTVGLRYVDESKDGSFDQIDGQHNACLGTFANFANVLAVQAAVDGVLGAGAVNVGGNAVALNCFVFAAPTLDRLQTLSPAAAANPFAFALLGQEFDLKFEDDELVYTVKAGYELNEDVNFYAGVTHGFKSGGFNLDASAGSGGADPRFASEKVDAYEIGMKASILDGRGVFNAAAFHQEMEDFQVLEFTGVRFVTFNVPTAKSSGFEVETQALLTDNFGASLGVTYTDARYPSDCAIVDATDPGFDPNVAALCGNSLTNAPDWVVLLGGTWEQPIMDGRANLFLTGSARYESDRRTTTQAVSTSDFSVPLAGDIQDSNTKVNLRLGVQSPDERWAIELWGKNITDERTKNVTFSIPLRSGARGQFVQDPATYGVTLRTKF